MSVRDTNVSLTYLLRNNLKNMLKKVKVKVVLRFLRLKKKNQLEFTIRNKIRQNIKQLKNPKPNPLSF